MKRWINIFAITLSFLLILTLFVLFPQSTGAELFYTHDWIVEEEQLLNNISFLDINSEKKQVSQESYGVFLKGELGAGIVDPMDGEAFWFPKHSILAGNGNSVIMYGPDNDTYISFDHVAGIGSFKNSGLPILLGVWNILLRTDRLGLTVMDSSFSKEIANYTWASMITSIEATDAQLLIGFLDGRVAILGGNPEDGIVLVDMIDSVFSPPIRGLQAVEAGFWVYSGQEIQSVAYYPETSGEILTINLPGENIVGAALMEVFSDGIVVERADRLVYIELQGEAEVDLDSVLLGGGVPLFYTSFLDEQLLSIIRKDQVKEISVQKLNGNQLFNLAVPGLIDLHVMGNGFIWTGAGKMGRISFYWQGTHD